MAYPVFFNSASCPFKFATVSFAPPIRCCTLPVFFSAFPSAFKLRSLIAFPISSLIVPFTSWKLPLILSFVLVFICLLRPRKMWIAALLSLFEGCHFCNLVAVRGLSRIEHLWSGPRPHFRNGQRYMQGLQL